MKIETLVQIEGKFVKINVPSGTVTCTDFNVTCRDCGPLTGPEVGHLLPTKLSEVRSLDQADLIQNRHLAEHLTALAQEIALAAR